jgi:CHAT domain-containing protein
LSLLRESLTASNTREADLHWWELSTLGTAFLRLGQADQAVDYYQRAIDRLELHRGRIASAEHRASFLGRNLEAYTDLVELLLERHRRRGNPGDDARAFHVFERSRARTIVEAVVQARAGVVDSQDLDERRRESAIWTRVDELGRQLRAGRGSDGERGRLLQELERAEQELDALIDAARRRNPRYAALQYPEPLTLEQTQSILSPSTALLAYSVSRRQVAAFVLTSTSFRAEVLAVSPGALAARVGNYADLIAQDDAAGGQAVSRRLYGDLIAPLAPHIPAHVRQLVVVPADVLHFLPFEALVSSAPGLPPRYLVEDFAVSYAPSATVLAELAPGRIGSARASEADLIVFANAARADLAVFPSGSAGVPFGVRTPENDRGLVPDGLPFSVAEARAISAYAGSGSRMLVNAEASEHQVKQLALDRYRVVHFAAHGLVSERAPLRSALVLAPGHPAEDGFLQAREIYGLKLAAELVVLSGCQTARGGILAGEGVLGLARACVYAGAQAVLASLWNVNDRGTASFMEEFYKQLAQGQPKAQALRSAKLQVLRDAPDASPRHWAAFVLIGHPDGGVPLSGPGPTTSRTWLAATLVLIGLAILAALLRARRIALIRV